MPLQRTGNSVFVCSSRVIPIMQRQHLVFGENRVGFLLLASPSVCRIKSVGGLLMPTPMRTGLLVALCALCLNLLNVEKCWWCSHCCGADIKKTLNVQRVLSPWRLLSTSRYGSLCRVGGVVAILHPCMNRCPFTWSICPMRTMPSNVCTLETVLRVTGAEHCRVHRRHQWQQSRQSLRS